MKKKFLIYLPVYNSFKNLPKIFSNISFYLKDYSIDFLVVDNNSEIYSKLKKISLIKKIKSKNKNINIFLIINNKNYGIGGSMKIMINFAKKNNYSYVCSLLTSGRYNEKMVIKEIKKKLKLKYDYILFSRFKKKKLANKYNRMRFYFNLIFIEMTKYLTKCRFTDPGSIS